MPEDTSDMVPILKTCRTNKITTVLITLGSLVCDEMYMHIENVLNEILNIPNIYIVFNCYKNFVQFQQNMTKLRNEPFKLTEGQTTIQKLYTTKGFSY